jgi:hypothetical protein
MTNDPQHDQPGWVANLLGWLSFIGLFSIGVIGASGANHPGGPSLIGAVYLVIGGLAFLTILLLVLRRWP